MPRFPHLIRNPLLVRAALLGGAAMLAFWLAACGSDDSNSVPAASTADAQALTGKFLTLLHEKDVEGLQAFLADSFMVQRATGTFQVKADYLGNLPDIGEFSIDNVVAMQTGDILVVRWDLTVTETIEGNVYATTPAPRLSTFIWNGDEWQLASHANFNAPSPPASPIN